MYKVLKFQKLSYIISIKNILDNITSDNIKKIISPVILANSKVILKNVEIHSKSRIFRKKIFRSAQLPCSTDIRFNW